MNQSLDKAANCAARCCKCCASMSQCVCSGWSHKQAVLIGNGIREYSIVVSK